MTLLSTSTPEPSHAYYSPHYDALKETSLTTKLRIVFNSSTKTINGISFNDKLYLNPKCHDDLFDVLFWLRQFNYVFFLAKELTWRKCTNKLVCIPMEFQRIQWKDNQGNLQT